MNAPESLRLRLRAELEKFADPERAAQQQRYMKSAMPYLGITMPDIRRTARDVFKQVPLTTAADWQRAVLLVWRSAEHREERYSAVELAGYNPYRKWLTSDALEMLEELIATGAWWDFVDAIAINYFGHLLKHEPRKLRPLLRRWAKDPNIWKRRTALLAQLKYKTETDEKLLFHAIEASLGEKEFFLRKGIGWALREYSKTAPDAVIDYVREHRETLSPLSKREALKVLIKKGAIDTIP